MDDQAKKPVIGSFSDMMEASEKKNAAKERGEAKERKNESSLERKNVPTNDHQNERTLKHHSFDVFVDQLISLDQIQTQIYQEKGKKPKIGTLVQEALDDYIRNHKNERIKERKFFRTKERS